MTASVVDEVSPLGLEDGLGSGLGIVLGNGGVELET